MSDSSKSTQWEGEQSLSLQPGFPELGSSFVDGISGVWHLVLKQRYKHLKS